MMCVMQDLSQPLFESEGTEADYNNAEKKERGHLRSQNMTVMRKYRNV